MTSNHKLHLLIRDKPKCLWVLLLISLLIPVSIHAQLIPGRDTHYVNWHPDGTMLAVGHDSSVEIVDAASGKILNTLTEFSIRTEPQWSPDGTYLAIPDFGDVQVWSEPWEPNTAHLVTTYQYYPPGTTEQQKYSVQALDWNPEGTLIASTYGSSFDIWEAVTGEMVRVVTGADYEWDRLLGLSWSVDNRIAVATNDGYVSTVNPETEEEINFFSMSSNYIPKPGIWSLDFSPDGSQLVWGNSVGIIAIWGDTRTTDLFTENPTLTYPDHPGSVYAMDWSPTGQWIASGGGIGRASEGDGTIRIWDPVTGVTQEVINLG